MDDDFYDPACPTDEEPGPKVTKGVGGTLSIDLSDVPLPPSPNKKPKKPVKETSQVELQDPGAKQGNGEEDSASKTGETPQAEGDGVVERNGGSASLPPQPAMVPPPAEAKPSLAKVLLTKAISSRAQREGSPLQSGPASVGSAGSAQGSPRVQFSLKKSGPRLQPTKISFHIKPVGNALTPAADEDEEVKKTGESTAAMVTPARFNAIKKDIFRPQGELEMDSLTARRELAKGLALTKLFGEKDLQAAMQPKPPLFPPGGDGLHAPAGIAKSVLVVPSSAGVAVAAAAKPLAATSVVEGAPGMLAKPPLVVSSIQGIPGQEEFPLRKEKAEKASGQTAEGGAVPAVITSLYEGLDEDGNSTSAPPAQAKLNTGAPTVSEAGDGQKVVENAQIVKVSGEAETAPEIPVVAIPIKVRTRPSRWKDNSEDREKETKDEKEGKEGGEEGKSKDKKEDKAKDKSKDKEGSRERRRSRERRSSRERSRQRDRSKDKEKDRTRKRSRERDKSKERDRSHDRSRRSRERSRRSRDRSRSRDRRRSRDRDRSRDRSRSRERRRSRDRSRERDRSKDRRRSRDRSRDRKRSKERDRSKDRKRSKERERSKERKRSKERERSTERKRSKEREKPSERKRSRDREKSKERDRSRERKRSKERERSKEEDKAKERESKRDGTRSRDTPSSRERAHGRDRSRDRSMQTSRRHSPESSVKRERRDLESRERDRKSSSHQPAEKPGPQRRTSPRKEAEKSSKREEASESAADRERESKSRRSDKDRPSDQAYSRTKDVDVKDKSTQRVEQVGKTSRLEKEVAVQPSKRLEQKSSAPKRDHPDTQGSSSSGSDSSSGSSSGSGSSDSSDSDSDAEVAPKRTEALREGVAHPVPRPLPSQHASTPVQPAEEEASESSSSSSSGSSSGSNSSDSSDEEEEEEPVKGKVASSRVRELDTLKKEGTGQLSQEARAALQKTIEELSGMSTGRGDLGKSQVDKASSETSVEHKKSQGPNCDDSASSQRREKSPPDFQEERLHDSSHEEKPVKSATVPSDPVKVSAGDKLKAADSLHNTASRDPAGSSASKETPKATQDKQGGNKEPILPLDKNLDSCASKETPKATQDNQGDNKEPILLLNKKLENDIKQQTKPVLNSPSSQKVSFTIKGNRRNFVPSNSMDEDLPESMGEDVPMKSLVCYSDSDASSPFSQESPVKASMLQALAAADRIKKDLEKTVMQKKDLEKTALLSKNRVVSPEFKESPKSGTQTRESSSEDRDGSSESKDEPGTPLMDEAPSLDPGLEWRERDSSRLVPLSVLRHQAVTPAVAKGPTQQQQQQHREHMEKGRRSPSPHHTTSHRSFLDRSKLGAGDDQPKTREPQSSSQSSSRSSREAASKDVPHSSEKSSRERQSYSDSSDRKSSRGDRRSPRRSPQRSARRLSSDADLQWSSSSRQTEARSPRRKSRDNRESVDRGVRGQAEFPAVRSVDTARTTDRNRRHGSRSPDRTWRRHSRSPDRSRRRSSRSPDRNRRRAGSRSPIRTSRRDSRSPDRTRRDIRRSRSPDRRRARDSPDRLRRRASPDVSYRGSSRSPDRFRRRRSRTPDRLPRRSSQSPDGYPRRTSRSPDRRRQEPSPPRHSQTVSSQSPGRSHRQQSPHYFHRRGSPSSEHSWRRHSRSPEVGSRDSRSPQRTHRDVQNRSYGSDSLRDRDAHSRRNWSSESPNEHHRESAEGRPRDSSAGDHSRWPEYPGEGHTAARDMGLGKDSIAEAAWTLEYYTSLSRKRTAGAPAEDSAEESLKRRRYPSGGAEKKEVSGDSKNWNTVKEKELAHLRGESSHLAASAVWQEYAWQLQQQQQHGQTVAPQPPGNAYSQFAPAQAWHQDMSSLVQGGVAVPGGVPAPIGIPAPGLPQGVPAPPLGCPPVSTGAGPTLVGVPPPLMGPPGFPVQSPLLGQPPRPGHLRDPAPVPVGVPPPPQQLPGVVPPGGIPQRLPHPLPVPPPTSLATGVPPVRPPLPGMAPLPLTTPGPMRTPILGGLHQRLGAPPQLGSAVPMSFPRHIPPAPVPSVQGSMPPIQVPASSIVSSSTSSPSSLPAGMKPLPQVSHLHPPGGAARHPFPKSVDQWQDSLHSAKRPRLEVGAVSQDGGRSAAVASSVQEASSTGPVLEKGRLVEAPVSSKAGTAASISTAREESPEKPGFVQMELDSTAIEHIRLKKTHQDKDKLEDNDEKTKGPKTYVISSELDYEEEEGDIASPAKMDGWVFGSKPQILVSGARKAPGSSQSSASSPSSSPSKLSRHSLFEGFDKDRETQAMENKYQSPSISSSVTSSTHPVSSPASVSKSEASLAESGSCVPVTSSVSVSTAEDCESSGEFSSSSLGLPGCMVSSSALSSGGGSLVASIPGAAFTRQDSSSNDASNITGSGDSESDRSGERRLSSDAPAPRKRGRRRSSQDGEHEGRVTRRRSGRLEQKEREEREKREREEKEKRGAEGGENEEEEKAGKEAAVGRGRIKEEKAAEEEGRTEEERQEEEKELSERELRARRRIERTQEREMDSREDSRDSRDSTLSAEASQTSSELDRAEAGVHPPPTPPHSTDSSSPYSLSSASPSVQPMKVKSRWRRASEAEFFQGSIEDFVPPPQAPQVGMLDENTCSSNSSADASIPPPPPSAPPQSMELGSAAPADMSAELEQAGEGENKEALGPVQVKQENIAEDLAAEEKKEEEKPSAPPYCEMIEENIHLTERHVAKQMKRMVCDCTINREERERGVAACGEDCLNRMLFIECGSRCPCGDYCTNKRFQKRQYANVEVFETNWKGWGLRSKEKLEAGVFIMEYVGEILDYREFKSRSKSYARHGQEHYYFMALSGDEVIDATNKGNPSRYINHSCDPNCETQKWTVNGQLRVGFFTRKAIEPMEELTFDYQFEYYGKEAQRCLCGASNCRGTIGSKHSTPARRNKKEKTVEKKTDVFEDLEEEIEQMTALEGLRNKDHVLNLCRLMVRAESTEHRMAILKILQSTREARCLRLFLDYHGLTLLWSWMADPNVRTCEELRLQILETLTQLPITNKTILKESKILPTVLQWAEEIPSEPSVPPPPPPPPPRAEEASEEADSNSDPPPPPLPMSNIQPVSILSSAKDTRLTRPHKKRVTFAEETASSDSDMSDSQKITSTSASGTLPGAEEAEAGEESQAPDFEEGKQEGGTEEQAVEKESGESKGEEEDASQGDKTTSASQQNSSEAEQSGEVTSAAMDDNSQDRDLSATAAEDNSSGDKSSLADSEACAVKSAAEMDMDETSNDEKYSMPGTSADSTMEGPGEVDREGDKLGREYPLDEDEEDEDGAGMNPFTKLITRLLESWSGLKELYKIPKKQRVEERKKTERELDVQEEKSSSYRDRDLARGEKRYSRDKKREERSNGNGGKARRSLLPTPPQGPKMSKEERRQAFEAKVRAEDEMAAAEYQRQQQEILSYYQTQGAMLLEDPVHFAYYQIALAVVTGQPVPDFSALGIGVPAPSSTPSTSTNPNPAFPQATQPGVDPSQYPQVGAVPTDPNYQYPQAALDPNLAFAQSEQYTQAVAAFAADPSLLYAHAGAIPSDPNLAPTVVAADPMQAQAFADPAQQALYQQQQQQYQQLQQAAGVYGQVPSATAGQSGYLAGQVFYGATQTELALSQTAGQATFPTTAQLTAAQQQLLAVPQQAATVAGSVPMAAVEEDIPPPPSPPRTKVQKLPPNWRSARDSEGRVYYYHTGTRQVQWDPPTWDQAEQDDMDLGTPTYDEVIVKGKRKTTTAAADTSTEVAKKMKDQFRNTMSTWIVECLNPYRKPDVKEGRITSTEDFKHLARKLTHHVMLKELKHCKHVEDLEVNENVKAKAKDFVKKYMSKFGSSYKKSPNND